MSAPHSAVPEHFTPESLLALPTVVPPFVRKIGHLAPEIGLAGAVDHVLTDANIHLEVAGDLSSADGEGLIIAGDHRHRLEPFLVQAMMNRVGRSASHVIAMPTSLGGRLLQASGPEGREVVIPVVPTHNSKDNRPPLTDVRASYRYHRYPNVFGHSKEDLRRLNAAALVRAAGEVSLGSTVMIHPTGNTVEAGSEPWLPGFGKIMQQLSPEARGNTQVAVMRPEAFPVRKVTAALALRDMGILPRPQTIEMRAEVLGSPEEVFGQLATTQSSEDAQSISNIASDRYRQSFGITSTAIYRGAQQYTIQPPEISESNSV
jgi:hypothetical protein